MAVVREWLRVWLGIVEVPAGPIRLGQGWRSADGLHTWTVLHTFQVHDSERFAGVVIHKSPGSIPVLAIFDPGGFGSDGAHQSWTRQYVEHCEGAVLIRDVEL